ncbi:hypothetical protein FBBAL38_09619 [Flavobacteria bacterium BAL38]|nr:hypothetical protein FBBAL38_09619 [Flavobacteria bacterium BAL38]
MKKIVYLSLFVCTLNLSAQTNNSPNSSSFKFDDKGFNFSFDNGAYEFGINGFIQPNISVEKTKGIESINKFNVQRSFFIVSGKAVKEKVSFLVQTDFSTADPLLDAWIAYHPYKNITITGGQKQTFVNNREMTYREDKLQFTDRSLLSKTLSKTGREFGLFIETKFKLTNTFAIAPMLAVTSGDGRNSFGASSTDTDLGGVKIGGRLDIFPLGYFTEGNDVFSADLAHEKTLKFVIGGAVSKNTGVSNAIGEGHGDFLLYGANGKNNLPDYSKVNIDFLLKYKGFSLLGEYANATASGLDLVFVDANATQILVPQEISEYLVLGNSYNFQAGYVTKKGVSFDVRYETAKPEFELNPNSILTDFNSYTLGLTKYFKNNNLKLQASFTNIDYAKAENTTLGQLLFQIGF